MRREATRDPTRGAVQQSTRGYNAAKVLPNRDGDTKPTIEDGTLAPVRHVTGVIPRNLL